MADNSGGILHPCLRSIFSKAIQKNKKGEIKLRENHALSLRQHALKRESKDRPRPQHVLSIIRPRSRPCASAAAHRGPLPGAERELVTGPEAGLKPPPGRPRPPPPEDTKTGGQGEQSAGCRARLKSTGHCLQKTEVTDVASGHRPGEEKRKGKISGPVSETRSPNISCRHPTSRMFRKARTPNDGPWACCLSCK